MMLLYIGTFALVVLSAQVEASSHLRYKEAEEVIPERLLTPDFRGAAIISALTKDVETVYTSTDIDKLLPHRYPFALVDRIVELEPGKRAVGIKSVTKNEDFFNGHFPDQPVMPGVLQLEALAQLAGVVFASAEDVSDGFAYIFGSADGVIWKKPVVPGDTLVMEVEVTKIVKKFGIAKVSGSGYTDGELAVEVSEMTLVLP